MIESEDFPIYSDFVDYDMRLEKTLRKEQTHLAKNNYETGNIYFRNMNNELDPKALEKYEKAYQGDPSALEYLKKMGVKKWFRNGRGAII